MDYCRGRGNRSRSSQGPKTADASRNRRSSAPNESAVKEQGGGGQRGRGQRGRGQRGRGQRGRGQRGRGQGQGCGQQEQAVENGQLDKPLGFGITKSWTEVTDAGELERAQRGRGQGQGCGQQKQAVENGQSDKPLGFGIIKSWTEVTDAGERERAQRGRGQGQGCGQQKQAVENGQSDKPLGFGIIKSWTEVTDAGELVLWIARERKKLDDLLQQTSMSQDMYRNLLHSLDFAISAQHQREALRQVLEVVAKSKFMNQLWTSFFATSCQSNLGLTDGDACLESLKNILTEIVDKLPHLASSCYASLTQMRSLIQGVGSTDFDQSTIDEMKDLEKKCLDLVLKSAKKETRPGRECQQETRPPPEDFTELPIFPDASELKSQSMPYLRAAVTKGAYDDENHYLDVQFRLMREDFASPLRDGLKDYLRCIGKPKGKSSGVSDVRVYSNVRFNGLQMGNGINLLLLFDVTNLKNVNWEASKRLMFGSLVCLSTDNFETFILASVANRDEKELKKGVLSVSIESGLKEVLCSSATDIYVMLESVAYFEAYRHVLEGIKEMKGSVPLGRNLIHCETNLKPPRYLLSGVHHYDLSSILKTRGKCEVPALSTCHWPSGDQVLPNKNQMEAVKLALTKEVAVIQGPPGTGKTYVGLRVMEILLANRDRICRDSEVGKDPILVVCYTNHALDQFLEGILQFCPSGVVRVGGKSRSDAMKVLNLSEIRKQRRHGQRHLKRALQDVYQEKRTLTSATNKLQQILSSLEMDVQDASTLQEFMQPHHYDSLCLGRNVGGCPARNEIQAWLNVSEQPFHEELSKSIRHKLETAFLEFPVMDAQANDKPTAKDIKKAGIVERIKLFRLWMKSKTHLNVPLRAIPDDVQMSMYINSDVISEIVDFMTKDGKIKLFQRGKMIKSWFLGSWKDLSSQLDDVQNLFTFLNTTTDMAQGDEDEFESNVISNDRDVSDLDMDVNQANFQAENEALKNSNTFLYNKAALMGLEVESRSDPDEEWQKAGRQKPKSFGKVRQMLNKVQAMGEEEEANIYNLQGLDDQKRFALYKLWIRRYKTNIVEEMIEHIEEMKTAQKKKKEIESEESISILRDAKVIGMTTTGAAKNRAVLQAVGCRIVVVEEAAEVLEAHIVTALNKNCNHLILIGDHQQLRPNPTVYELAKHYNLDISLFERLIKNGVPHASLTEQHRMRESISTVMRHIYPDLMDHVSVKTYEHVEGVAHDMFFLQHEELESSIKDTKSKSNKYEAEYLVSLCKYFLNQGYQPSQITILATYVGQIRALQQEMKSKNDGRGQTGVRMSTVDNFQGEENDIILLSLVRSNEKNSVGFLKVDNRICVALSRAKKGLFVVGNLKLLKSQSKLWTNILATASSQNMTGNALPVVCRNHRDNLRHIKLPSDFDKLCPEGGCDRPCGFRLACGHACNKRCHGYDREHKIFKCPWPCQRTCDQGHVCKRKCFEKCGPCKEKVPKTIPRCGHANMLFCSQDATQAVCSARCLAILECEHQCRGTCSECSSKSKHDECKILVQYTWPCGHTRTVPCFQNPSKCRCPSKCQAILDCGHPCAGDCSSCLKGAVHKACANRCKLKIPCGHPCQSLCGLPCGPCALDCPTECAHSACSNKVTRRPCGDLCIPCQEPCSIGCEHQKHDQKCSQPSTRALCSKRCTKQVQNCNHPCMGLCGEVCVCGQCEPIQDVPQANQTPMDGQANKGDKQGVISVAKKNGDNPILIKLPSCNHVFQLNRLDAYLKSVDSQGSGYLLCPKCAKPIQKCSFFEADNKKRAEKRNLLKLKRAQESKVKPGQMDGLQKSLQLVKKSRGQWEWLSDRNVNLIKTRCEMKSASLIVRFAFAVEQIESIQEGFSRRDLTLDVEDSTKLLKSLGPILTAQQVKEVKLYLKKLLLQKTLDALCILCTDIELTPEAASLMKKSPKLIELGYLDTAELSMVQILLEVEIGKGVQLQGKSKLIQKVSDRVCRVLDADDSTMLCDVSALKSTCIIA